jgi:hypothetical protein
MSVRENNEGVYANRAESVLSLRQTWQKRAKPLFFDDVAGKHTGPHRIFWWLISVGCAVRSSVSIAE